MVFTAYRGLCRQKLKSHISSSLWSKENTNHMYNQWLFQVLSVHKSYLFSSVAGPGWKADRETYKEFLKIFLKQKFYKDNSKVKGEPTENLNAEAEEKKKHVIRCWPHCKSCLRSAFSSAALHLFSSSLSESPVLLFFPTVTLMLPQLLPSKAT